MNFFIHAKIDSIKRIWKIYLFKKYRYNFRKNKNFSKFKKIKLKDIENLTVREILSTQKFLEINY